MKGETHNVTEAGRVRSCLEVPRKLLHIIYVKINAEESSRVESFRLEIWKSNPVSATFKLCGLAESFQHFEALFSNFKIRIMWPRWWSSG